MEAGDTRVFLQAYPGIFAFLPGYNFFPTGGKYLPNWGEEYAWLKEGGGGGLWSKTNELMIFFRIKDNIIVAKSVLIAEKVIHLRRFFANKVKTGN